MLVRCPKCHFEQPSDPFCAKCGIEMSTFKPPAETLIGKILKNTTTLFFIVMVGLFAGTFFFFKATQQKKESFINDNRRSSLSQRQYINSQEQKIEVDGEQKPNSQIPSTQPSNTENTLAASKDIKDQSIDEIRENLESQLFKKESTSKEPAAASQFELRVYYAEVSAKGLDMLFQEARANGQLASIDYSQGVVNMPMTKILSYRDDFSVYSETTKLLEKNKATDWFQGLKSGGPDSDIGISQSAQIKDSPSGRTQLELKISKRYQVNPREGSEKRFQTVDYIGAGEIEKQTTYFMAEILSKEPMSSQQDYLISISPFEIYKSQNFLSGKTFSVFFYTVENK